MVKPFNELPENSRIWIFPSPKPLDEKEAESTVAAMNAYINEWSAHGSPLTGGCAVLRQHFLVVAVDETVGNASGCSIDDFRRALGNIEQQSGLRFSDASFVPFEKEGTIQFIPFHELPSRLASGDWSGETITYSPTVQIKGDLLGNWRIKSSESWLQRLLKSKKENVTS